MFDSLDSPQTIIIFPSALREASTFTLQDIKTKRCPDCPNFSAIRPPVASFSVRHTHSSTEEHLSKRWRQVALWSENIGFKDPTLVREQ